MTWLMAAMSCMMTLLSCGKHESSRFVFHSSEEAVTACHKELSTLREIKKADIGRLTAVIADWLALQDSVYNFMAKDTTIHLNTSLTTDYYNVSDSIRGELARIAKLQTRSLRDVTYLKIHTAQGRSKVQESKEFKTACGLFRDMDRMSLYSDLTATLSTYDRLLDTTVAFPRESGVVDFLCKEDRCFRSLMTFLYEVDQQDLAAITSKTSRLFDNLYGMVPADGNSAVSERMTLLLTMRFNRRIIQNAEACMKDIHARRPLSDQQRDNYRWMLIQPFMSIDGYAMSLLTDRQEKTLLLMADELPSLFAFLDDMAGNSATPRQLDKVLSDFFLNTYLKSSL